MTETNQKRPLGDEPGNDAKRLKANDKEDGITGPPTADVIRNVLQLDPGVFVGMCKADDTVLAQLKSFVKGLRKGIKRVDRHRAETKAEKIRAKRQALIDAKKCLSCSKACDSGHESDSHDEFLNKNVHSEGNCCEGYQECPSCDKARICIPCLESGSWETCNKCKAGYCSDCVECLEVCHCKALHLCDGCADGTFRSCECGNKVCEKCQVVLECGNDDVLCGDCDECKCEYCEGSRMSW